MTLISWKENTGRAILRVNNLLFVNDLLFMCISYIYLLIKQDKFRKKFLYKNYIILSKRVSIFREM